MGEQLEVRDEHCKQLLQRSSVAMLVSRGVEQKVELMNDKFTALSGYTIDDVPDVNHWWPLAYPDEAYRQAIRNEWQARVEEAICNGADIEPMEATVRCKDGSTRHIEAHLACIGDTNLVTLIDLTERKRAEAALRKSEERLVLAAQAGKMYAYEWDVATDTITRSPEYVNILGFSGPPMQLTRHQILDRVHPDDRALLVGSVDQMTAANPATQIRYRMLRPDGGVIWLESRGRAFFDVEGKLERVIGMVADITERKRAEEALSGVSRKLIEAHEQERSRIGRELHDDIVQRLSLLGIRLEGLHENIPDSATELGKVLADLRDQSLQLTKDVQSLSHELHSSKLEYVGIVGAIKNFCKEFGERQRLEIDFQTHDLPAVLPNHISLSLFRVLQEAVYNATKHSGAKSFEVKLWARLGEIHLTVSDRGAGFDAEAAMKGTGLGLTSMQERLRLVGGELSIDSKLKRGTTVHARVPFTPSSDYAPAAG
jgi:PAS domain S-box-containing protein